MNINVPVVNFPLSFSRFAVVWLSMAVAMSANGIARELLLKRFMNGRSADVMSAVIGIALIAFITWLGFRQMSALSPSFGQLALVAVGLVLLTVLFETVLGLYVDHKTWPQILDHYAIWKGELWLVVLAWLALTPFVWGRA